MKKLSLKNLTLGTEELLQREQLKTIFGGYENNSDYNKCCWVNHSTSCSSCKRGGTTCVEGAILVPCSFYG